jgi:hypothetical protein
MVGAHGGLVDESRHARSHQSNPNETRLLSGVATFVLVADCSSTGTTIVVARSKLVMESGRVWVIARALAALV